MRRLILFFIGLLIPLIGFTQSTSLQFVIPDSNNLTTSLSRHRYGGHTDPRNRVTLNGNPVKVYPTGAIAGLLSLEIGSNQFEFKVSTPDGRSESHILTFERTPPLTTTPDNIIQLEQNLMLPDRNQDLLPGDIVSFRVKGTPGARVFARIDKIDRIIEMIESPPENHDGMRGIYTGIYQIQFGDKFIDSSISYHLENSAGQTAQIQSEYKITVDTGSWPKVGLVSRATGAFLSVGLGEARLGGAQHGYIPVSTKLILDGSFGRNYRVRLTPQFHAYIPQDFVTVLPQGTLFPHSFVGLATLESTDNFDQIIIRTDERLPYIIQDIMHPPTIRIHIFGATSNFTWITNIEPLKIIEDIRWTQVSNDHLQLDIILSSPIIWGYEATYPEDSNALRIRIRHPPKLAQAPANPLRGLTIAVDAGHGGEHPGARGATGALEKDVVWAISNLLKSRLEANGAKVVMTRIAEDETTLMRTRIDRTLQGNADLLISIHSNSIPYSSDPITRRGTSVYYKHPFNRDMARAIQKRMEQIRGFARYGMVSSFNFSLNKMTEIPSILVETAFISNPEEEAVLISESGQKQIADAVMNGLLDYLKSIR